MSGDTMTQKQASDATMAEKAGTAAKPAMKETSETLKARSEAAPNVLPTAWKEKADAVKGKAGEKFEQAGDAMEKKADELQKKAEEKMKSGQ